jgi:hypothetical protein
VKQQPLALAAGFELFGQQTRRSEFLSQMERVVPWADLVALIEPYYPKAGNGSRPVGLQWMLRIYFMQQWFNLSGPAIGVPGRGCTARLAQDAQLREHRSWQGACAGRDYGVQVPPSAEASQSGQADVDAGQRLSGSP